MSATAENVTPGWPELGAPPDLPPPASDPTLSQDVLAHLDRQLLSVRHMRQIVCAQAVAIRRRAVRDVVASAGQLQVEMYRRELLERERMSLMERAASQLATAPEAVGFTSVQRLMDPGSAQLAAVAVAELTDMLKQVDREHQLNRKLLAQELAFLDHLLALADGTGGYAARPAAHGAGAIAGVAGTGRPRIRRDVNAARRRVFDMEA